jgi:hypothetical protein
MAVGLVILNSSALGLSNDGKILLKEVHTLIGYAFVLNLFGVLFGLFLGIIMQDGIPSCPEGKDFCRQCICTLSLLFPVGLNNTLVTTHWGG